MRDNLLHKPSSRRGNPKIVQRITLTVNTHWHLQTWPKKGIRDGRSALQCGARHRNTAMTSKARCALRVRPITTKMASTVEIQFYSCFRIRIAIHCSVLARRSASRRRTTGVASNNASAEATVHPARAPSTIAVGTTRRPRSTALLAARMCAETSAVII